MKPASGLRKQIIQSLAVMTLGIMFLSVFGSYAFYALATKYMPGSISETWVPSRVELIWIACTIIAALGLALYVGIRLSRRILTPLNSVARSLRELAQGGLDARAPMDKNALGETAQLILDFNTMAERLQQVTREREFWNAAVAHELRTPVTILRGRLQGLSEGVFSSSKEVFDGLLRQVEGLTRLIEDLRVVSLNDSGHLELQRAETRLAEDINAVIESYTAILETKGFKVNQQLDFSCRVSCDVTRICQALMALLENAVQHADPGHLTVRFYVQDKTCYLSVEDEGPGISNEAADFIFDAFRRGEPSRSRKSGGSGLGLAVVKAIIQAHGGTAICQRSDDKGTVFILAWPTL